MHIFSKKKTELPPAMSDAEIEAALEPAVNFNSVVEYLEGLSKPDYEKIIKVTNIYRNADKDAAKVLGIQNEPSTVINKESRPDVLADDNDDIELLTGDEPVAKPNQKKKVKS